jgi:hypothetical protein
MSSAGFEPVIPASEWPQTNALGRAAIINILLRDIVNYIFTDNHCIYCKIEWQGGVSYVVILKKCYSGYQINEDIMKGGMARMEAKKNAYRILVGKPEGKIPLERFKSGWINNI